MTDAYRSLAKQLVPSMTIFQNAAKQLVPSMTIFQDTVKQLTPMFDVSDAYQSLAKQFVPSMSLYQDIAKQLSSMFDMTPFEALLDEVLEDSRSIDEAAQSATVVTFGDTTQESVELQASILVRLLLVVAALALFLHEAEVRRSAASLLQLLGFAMEVVGHQASRPRVVGATLTTQAAWMLYRRTTDKDSD